MLETYRYLLKGFLRSSDPADRGEQLRDAMVPRPKRQAYVQEAQLAASRPVGEGLAVEMSWRLPGEKILINRPGSWLAALSFEELIVVSLRDEAFPWHCAVYNRSAARAVLLCQPVASTVMAARQQLPVPDLLQQAPEVVGHLALLAQESELAERLPERGALLLHGHGLIAWDVTAIGAIAVAETVERWCAVTLAHGEVSDAAGKGRIR